MVSTKKVDKTPYELCYGKVLNLSYLKVWGYEALVKRDTPDKLQQRFVKCIFIGYPKETMGYYFYFPPEIKIVVARFIYGLKQASRSWNKRFEEEIKRLGFAQNLDEPCVSQKASESNVTFLILYVDDIIIMRNHIPMLQSVKSYLGKCFAMKDLEEAAFIFGIKIYRDRSRQLIRLSQSAYMDKYLKRFKMDNSKRENIPMQERLDLNKIKVDWKSSKQSTTLMSAKEAEYMANSEAAMEAIWIRKFISWLGIVPTINEPVKMLCDNSVALLIANEPGVQKDARHYHKIYHYVHGCIELGEINLLKVHIDNNL
nr:putative retrotransposon protein [Tanacetum cinerariifolium]